MSLKQPSAGILVHCVGVVVVEVLDSLFKARVFQTLVDGVGEEFDVGIEGELVHGVNTAHVVHHEEENGCPL